MTFNDDAIAYVKLNKNTLVKQFCKIEEYEPIENPMTFFMAGSPGSGKTEYSSGFISNWLEEHPESKILRLDVDELREFIPGYTGSNSDQVQRACTILFEKIQDFILEHDQNVFVDGTFSSPKSIDNIKRHIKHKRRIGIIYLYQNPFIAWEYTKKRELLEGRTVPKEVFVKAYFESRKNINEVKKIYGKDVQLDVIIKNKDNSFKNTFFNVEDIDSRIIGDREFTLDSLMNLLPESIDK